MSWKERRTIISSIMTSTVADFDPGVNVYSGPMVTVLGTSLQNRDVLERFHSSSWKAIGLEMEGGHYQRAINAAIIQGHIPMNMKTRYAYYASDNPWSAARPWPPDRWAKKGSCRPI